MLRSTSLISALIWMFRTVKPSMVGIHTPPSTNNYVREPTCGGMVRRAVAPLAHQGSNPRFDALVSHKKAEYSFSGRRRSRR